jgi:hypothetical protein
MRRPLFMILAAAAALGTLSAQGLQRKASRARVGPGGGEGCTIDVVVDGAAEVEIRGDDAVLKNLSGQAPQFRAFDCSRPMPPNAPGFQFTVVDGRGRMELVRTPREGGPVVVRIDDPQPGQGEYRFEITWAGGRVEQGYRGEGDRNADRDHQGYQQERERFFQGEAWRRNLFQRVREDVEHLTHSTFPFTGDQSRLSTTIFELNELQTKLGQGRYDEHQLDDVLNALTNVLHYNRISAQDRDVLTDDLRRLREFRDHHDDYGARFGRGDQRN